jgi:hypothetical protein
VASLASLIAALSCCLPLGTLLMAAGSTGASALSQRLRPWLLALSVALLIFGFIQTYIRGRCEFRHRRFRTVLLWLTAALVLGMLLLPRQISSLLAGQNPWVRAASTLRQFDIAAFQREFDAAADRTRIVVLLSPTWTTCLRGASAVENVLRRNASAGVRVFVIWEPVLETDWGDPGQRITGYVPDARAVHFWDPARRLSSLLGGAPRLDHLAADRSIGFRMNEVIWDAALVYPPGAKWGDRARPLVAPGV